MFAVGFEGAAFCGDCDEDPVADWLAAIVTVSFVFDPVVDYFYYNPV